MKRYARGFTLIEIAIVLVIIGLLLGGVLKGQELITGARVRNMISQQDGIKAAFFGFQDRYRALPGGYAAADTTNETSLGFYGDYGSTSGANDTTQHVVTNKWMTIVVTFDGQESRIYIDGQLKNAVKQSAVFTPNVNDLFIGRAESDQYPYWWNGVVDEIRVYKKALCEGAVKQLSGLKN